MAKTLGLGTELYVESDTPTVFVKVGNLTSVPAPSIEKGEVEVTDLDSVAREYLGTLPDNGEIAFSGYGNAADAGQAILRADATDPESVERNWEIRFTRQGMTCAFSGFVRRYMAFSAGGPDEALTMEGAIRITGAISFEEDS